MSIFKHSQFVDGVGITDLDLSNISKFLRGQVFGAMSSWAQFGELDTPRGLYGAGVLWCFGAGGLPYAAAEASLSLTNLDGAIAQCQRTTDVDLSGDDADLEVYYLAKDELHTTFDAPDATHPRWDLVCIKLDNADGPTVTRHFKDDTTGVITSQSKVVTRLPRLTKQVVSGTPAADPTEPAVPAGYVKYAAVKISPGDTELQTVYTADNSVLRDYRMPVGIHVIDMLPLDGVCDASVWIQGEYGGNGGGYARKIQNAAVKKLTMFPRGPIATHGRLVRAALSERHTAAGSARVAQLVRTDLLYGAGGIALGDDVLVKDMSSTLLGGSAADNFNIASLLSASPPIWMNGWPNPLVSSSEVSGGSRWKLGIEYLSGGDNAGYDIIKFARFWVAG